VFLECFSNNNLNGTIPETLFELDKLQVVYFSNNSLSGSIPSNYGNAAALQDLYLQDNDLVTGPISDPSLNGLASITEILINDNRLSGSVREGLCELRATIPDFDVLFADCAPPSGSDVPQNACDCVLLVKMCS